MTSLDQIAQPLSPESPGEHREPTPRQPADTGLDRAMTFAGLTPAEVQVLVMVGLPDLARLEAAFEQLPALEGVLILEPEQPNLFPLLGRTLASGRGSVDPTRCFLANLDEPGVPTGLSAYLQLFQFFRAVNVGPGAALVLPDPSIPATDKHRAALAAARDFCSGFSADFFARGHDSVVIPSALLRATADLLYQHDERYHALKFYLRVHRSAPQPDVAWRILECWSELGCLDQAKRWLQEPVFSESFRRQLGDEIESALAEQRTTRARIFEQNRAALAAHFPGAAARLKSDPGTEITIVELPPIPWLLTYQAGEITVERAPYSLLVRFEQGRLVELNPPAEPEAIHRAMTPPEGRDPHHACVNGWVDHWATALILLSTDLLGSLPGWHRVINLIEPDVRALSLLLQTADLHGRLQPDRVHLFLGDEAERDFLAFLAREPDHVIPGIWAGVGPRLQAKLSETVHAREERVAEDVRRLERLYTPSYPERILEAVSGRESRPLRVLFITSRYSSVVQYIAHDLAATFRGLGHESLVVLEERPGQELSFATVTAKLLTFAPDLVFLTNHTRAEHGRILPAGLPVVTWIQDEMPGLADPAFIRALGPLDLTYGYSPTVQARYQRLGYPFVGHLPFAVSPVISPVPAVCRPQVAYATHLEPLHEPASCPGLAAWLEQRLTAEARIPIGTPRIDPILTEACVALGHQLEAPQRSAALFWAAMFARRLDRLRVADTLLHAGIPLALYGRGWDTMERFRSMARGVVQPGEPLRQVLSENKVVLHINGECNLHPRVLEGFAAGGFVLGRHEDSDDLPGETADQLAIGRELVLFRNDEEMIALIRRALVDEDWRRGVIEAAQARIRSSHTYASRARVILDDLDRHLRAHVAPRRPGS